MCSSDLWFLCSAQKTGSAPAGYYQKLHRIKISLRNLISATLPKPSIRTKHPLLRTGGASETDRIRCINLQNAPLPDHQRTHPESSKVFLTLSRQLLFRKLYAPFFPHPKLCLFSRDKYIPFLIFPSFLCIIKSCDCFYKNSSNRFISAYTQILYRQFYPNCANYIDKWFCQV